MVLLLCVYSVLPSVVGQVQIFDGCAREGLELMRVQRDPLQGAVLRSLGFWDDSIRWCGFKIKGSVERYKNTRPLI